MVCHAYPSYRLSGARWVSSWPRFCTAWELSDRISRKDFVALLCHRPRLHGLMSYNSTLSRPQSDFVREILVASSSSWLAIYVSSSGIQWWLGSSWRRQDLSWPFFCPSLARYLRAYTCDFACKVWGTRTATWKVSASCTWKTSGLRWSHKRG